MATMANRKYTNLSGAQKAALLVLTVGDVQGGKIFALLHEDEIREISRAMVQIGPVPAEMIETLVGEFTASVDASSGVTGSIETTQRVLAQNLPANRVAQIMEEIAGPPGRTMWDRLGNVDESVLAAFLKNEYPQTIAVVLSKIKPERAAKVLSELPSALAIEVVMRLLKMETVQKDVLEGVERTLQSEFMANLTRTNKRDPHELMAGIFNNLDRKTEIGFPRGIGAARPGGRRAHSIADVHLRRPGEDFVPGDPAAAAQCAKGPHRFGAEGCTAFGDGCVLQQPVRSGRARCCERTWNGSAP